jgi:hypothetical protein
MSSAQPCENTGRFGEKGLRYNRCSKFMTASTLKCDKSKTTKYIHPNSIWNFPTTSSFLASLIFAAFISAGFCTRHTKRECPGRIHYIWIRSEIASTSPEYWHCEYEKAWTVLCMLSHRSQNKGCDFPLLRVSDRVEKYVRLEVIGARGL